MKRAKLSARTTPKLRASVSQSMIDDDGRADQTDQPEPEDRHPLARLAEGLGEHGRRGREHRR